MKVNKYICKILTVLLLLVSLFTTISACGDNSSDKDVTKLSFKSASGYDYLKTLDGTLVKITVAALLFPRGPK